MIKVAKSDIAIFGGGIAGLWLLNQIEKLGLSVILLEENTLGGGQTHKAQGIIHGGIKYALQGSQTSASQFIAEMPALWQQCLTGKGEIDLSNVPITSPCQYLFSTNKFTGKLAGFFAGLALQGKVDTLAPEEFPEVFQHKKFKGVVYALKEIAIDVSALLRELTQHKKNIFKINSLVDSQLQLDTAKHLKPIFVSAANGDGVYVEAQKYIFTAGIGNEALRPIEKPNIVGMQRRPLHMVLVKTEFSFPVFAHCLGVSAVPRITITTHKANDGKYVWYLGGQLAEEGVHRSAQKQIEFTKKELNILFPWLDFSNACFASFLVDRAEPLQSDGKRPDSCFLQELNNVIVGWPTKLALAPKLSQEIIATLLRSHLKPHSLDTQAMSSFSQPRIARPIWDALL